MKRILLGYLCISLFHHTTAQENRLANRQANPAEIYHDIEKLGFLGTALYVAAHPDDENTRMISWLANEKMARTAYLSLTRGDGGQNLIGPELREQLGMIRTQELLEARNIDGGEQFFTRANDFGYSKTPEETLDIWNKEEVLADVVRIIRRLQPDIIINRFDHRTAGTTHGHHTSSAMLSVEAFELAGKKNALDGKLGDLQPWQPERLFFNTSWWFYGSRENFEKADKSDLLTLDVGSYYDYKGLSNNEMAALSRSQHKSQGFGSRGSRGSETEYLEFLKGSFPSDTTNPFSGINTTWTRVKGGSKIQTLLNEIQADYDFKNPEASLEKLLTMREMINKLKNDHWKKIKLSELDQIIKQILGLYLEASTGERQATPSETVEVNLEISNRSSRSLKFDLPSMDDFNALESVDVKANNTLEVPMQIKVKEDTAPTSPYYLKKSGSIGMYVVDQSENIGKPELEPAYSIPVGMTINGQKILYNIPVIHKRTDRVRGEVNEPFNIVPQLSVVLNQPVYIFRSGQTQQIQVRVKAYADAKNVSMKLDLPSNWSYEVDGKNNFDLKAGEEKTLTFKVEAPASQSVGEIIATATVDGKNYDQEVILIDYDHIPDQQLVRKNTAQVVNPDLTNLAQRVAYINGAGDQVAQAIEAMGSQVTRFEPRETPTDLGKFDAVVVGIRAFNVAPEEMASIQGTLKKYVESGGTLIMQYNTSRGISSDALGPLPITLSRKRVTDETAAVKFINPKHPLLNSPNKITSTDFENWVQERGLYFPDEWDEQFTPLLEMNDAVEDPTRGSLLVADYGKGHIIYTGLSFFRELPAGVPGAYRLMANMLSVGAADKSPKK